MSNFPQNFLQYTPINVGMFSHIHAASEERIWYNGFLFGTGEVSSFPFGPIDLTIPHDFYSPFNYSGAPLIVISGNEMVRGSSGNYKAEAPVWLKENLPTPLADSETRLVVQEGMYYYATGGAWRIVSGGFPYITLSSKNEIKKLRLSLSGLLYNTFPSSDAGYLDSGTVQETRNLQLTQATDDPFAQITGFMYNPFGLFNNRKATISAFENIPERLINQNVGFAVANSNLSTDTFHGNNLDQITDLILCREHILPLYTGIVQARYWLSSLSDFTVDSARDFGLVGAVGDETFTITLNGKISWVGPQDCFTIANGTVVKTRGTIGTYELENTITRTINLDEFVAFESDDVVFTLFSGVSRRGPNFDGFETAPDLATDVGVYSSLPSPVPAANTRAYTWNGTDFVGFISDGSSWNNATLLPNKYYEQRIIDVDNLGVIPRSPSGGANQSGVILEQINIASMTLNSPTMGPNGIKNIYGMLSENTLFFSHQEVDKIQFAKLGESATYPAQPYHSGQLSNSPGGGINDDTFRDAPDLPLIVFDAYAYLKWR